MPDVTPFLHQTLLGEAWDNATVALAVFSDDGRYIACNTAFCQLTGYTRAEVITMRVGVDLAPDERANTQLFREIVGDVRVVGSGGLKKKDGSVITVNFWAIRTRAAHLPYYLVLYWDAATSPARDDVA